MSKTYLRNSVGVDVDLCVICIADHLEKLAFLYLQSARVQVEQVGRPITHAGGWSSSDTNKVLASSEPSEKILTTYIYDQGEGPRLHPLLQHIGVFEDVLPCKQ
eukprot:scaffold31462_cov20-Prasinocladus_malaysianus.AAC.4